MTKAGEVRGFEDIWRAPGVRWIGDKPTVKLTQSATRARLARIVAHAPEVVVRVTAAMHSPRQLRDHLNYVSRSGNLEIEISDGLKVAGQSDLRELVDDWLWAARTDTHRTPTTTIARSMVLSMPPGTDGERLEVAARGFLQPALAGFDYIFVRHTDAPNPHVHVAVRSLGEDGRRFTPQKAHLDAFRRHFAEALRAQGIEAEATPRRARGVVLKAEHRGLRRVRANHVAGRGLMADVDRREMIRSWNPVRRDTGEPWRAEIRNRRQKMLVAYYEAAESLRRSERAEDRALALEIARFILAMPGPLTRRDLADGQAHRKHQAHAPDPPPTRERVRRERERDG